MLRLQILRQPTLRTTFKSFGGNPIKGSQFRFLSSASGSSGPSGPSDPTTQPTQPVPGAQIVKERKSIQGPLKDTSQLFVAISELDNYGIQLNSFPTVAVVGPQSSGKSSVLEAICGKDVLPKGDKEMVTMKPIHVTTIRSDETKFKIGDRVLLTEKAAREELERLNSNPRVPKIEMVVRSPDVYNSFLVDLPGLFSVSKKNLELKKEVKAMSDRYVQDKNVIPVVVTSATQDPATNQGIQLIGKHDRENDTMGVITKTDLTEGQSTSDLEKMLRNEKYPLGYGYIAVVLRSKNDLDRGLSVSDKIEEEKKFFGRKKSLKPAGVVEVRRRISGIQFDRIKDNIPTLIQDIDRTILELQSSESFLDTVANDPHNRLSIRLKLLVEKLVGSSLEKAKFERELKKAFEKSINGYMEETFKEEIDLMPQLAEGESRVDSYIWSFHSDKHSDPTAYSRDTFKELFSYGFVSPVVVNLETIYRAFARETQLSCALPLIKLTLDDPLGEKRLDWNKYLQRYFDSLLHDHNIQDIVYQITEDLLLKYIYEDPAGSDELTRKFAEYMIKEIGSQAYESKIRYSIEAMINTEKRPNISNVEVIRQVSKIYPEHFKYVGGLNDFWNKSKKQLEIEIYGPVWNIAYLRAVSDKLAENCYRNVAVNLLDKMIEKLLEMTIDMLNTENAIREKNKVNEKIKKLQELKATILEYS